MAEVVLFHRVQGPTDGVWRAWPLRRPAAEACESPAQIAKSGPTATDARYLPLR
jgi:hypothetical protein